MTTKNPDSALAASALQDEADEYRVDGYGELSARLQAGTHAIYPVAKIDAVVFAAKMLRSQVNDIDCCGDYWTATKKDFDAAMAAWEANQ